MNLLLKIHHFLIPKGQDIGYSVYSNLLVLSLFFGNLYLSPVHGVELAIVVSGFFTFLVLYFRAFSVQENELPFYIAAIFLIGIGLSEITFGANVFFVYAAAFSGEFYHKRKAFLSLLLVLAFTALYAVIADKSSYFWIPAIFMSITLGLLNIHHSEVLKKNKALKQSQQEAKQLAKIAERERISRDLHDLLGHSLSVITLKSELSSKMIDKGISLEKIKTEIKSVEELSRKTLAQVRDAVKGYNVATINGELLQIKVATQAAKIELIVNIEVESLPIKFESELALIIREAITNVIRHAETEKVWIDLKQVATHLTLTISDQGQIITKNEQSGMQNMRTRIDQLGGKMAVKNTPNTQLIFTLTLPEQSKTSDVKTTLMNVTNG
ncbi:sensor histidine kinase [uncultured Microbulbifer sp.]|uniref:sensor histidine kinase n=1 Tax=uncultured Microbulbifer sp. TaxID=348147 RepID=UPI00261F4471|nr:sensor histidine kinase [uncultured Microbulbifer sp.]